MDSFIDILNVVLSVFKKYVITVLIIFLLKSVIVKYKYIVN